MMTTTTSSTSSYSQTYRFTLAKLLFFTLSSCASGWNRYQTSFFLATQQASSTNTRRNLGLLKSFGLLLKLVAEPSLCCLADQHSQMLVILISLSSSIISLEILRRTASPSLLLLFFVRVLRTLTSPLSTLTTTTVLALTSDSSYGSQKAYSSLGWGFGVLVTGFVIDATSLRSGLFGTAYFFNFLMIGLIVLAFKVPGVGDKTKNKIEKEFSEEQEQEQDEELLSPSNDDVAASVRNRRMQLLHTSRKEKALSSQLKPTYFQLIRAHPTIRALLANAILFGIVMVVVDTTFFVALEIELSYSRSALGYFTALSTLTCIPLFTLSDGLIRRYGPFKLMIIAQSLLIVRLLVWVYVFSQKIAFCAGGEAEDVGFYLLGATQLLHGFNFALYNSAAVKVIRDESPSGMLNGALSGLNVSYFTIGGIVGNMLCK
jgi:hypothetical protein